MTENLGGEHQDGEIGTLQIMVYYNESNLEKAMIFKIIRPPLYPFAAFTGNSFLTQSR